MKSFVAVLLCTLLASEVFADAPPAPTPPDPARVKFQWGVKIPLRDGVKLNATVYTPRDQKEPAPCVFTLTPYISQSYHDRGLYFASQWDSTYVPLLEMADPGGPALRGGLLVARVGRGTYVYTGLSFFRQLPAGVPGALRLFLNLLDLRGRSVP